MLQPTDIQKALLAKYLSNQELESHLKDYVKRCSKISRLVKFGKSGQGADLVALHVSSQPDKQSAVPKPQFKYVGNIHGDEPSGRQLLLVLAERLCAGYPSEPSIKKLVDSVELYLIPTLNPDGYAAHRRENAAGTDLNRNFPDPVKLRGKDLTQPVGPEQPETRAIMAFTLEHRFVASLALHEGALVANYPYDGYPDGDLSVKGSKHASPDDAAFMHLARLYAKLHTTMSRSAEFKEGITNGAQWYPLYGGMQDWNYLAAGCMEVTLELNDNKWPAPPRLSEMWVENQAALLQWPLATLAGVHGVVKGEGPEGKPLPLAATVLVDGIAHNTSTGPQYGDYYRILAPGDYTLRVLAHGYKEATAKVSVPADGSGVTKDFLLAPLVPFPVKAKADQGSKVTVEVVRPGVSKHPGGDEPQEEWVLVHGGPTHGTHSSGGSSGSGTSGFVKILAIIAVQVLAVGAFMAWRRLSSQWGYSGLPVSTIHGSPARQGKSAWPPV